MTKSRSGLERLAVVYSVLFVLGIVSLFLAVEIRSAFIGLLGIPMLVMGRVGEMACQVALTDVRKNPLTTTPEGDPS